MMKQPDLVALATALQDAADYLLNIELPGPPDKNHADDLSAQYQFLRTYRVTEVGCKLEKDMLKAYDANTLEDVIYEIYNELSAPVMLFEGYTEGREAETEEGFKLATFARQLQKKLVPLSKFCTLCAEFQLIQCQTPVE